LQNSTYDIFLTNQDLYAFRLVYSLLMIVAKSAILIEWNHLFVPPSTRNWFFWASSILCGLNILVYLVAMILTITSCIPTQKAWASWIDGKCFPKRFTDIFAACFNLVMDLGILILPQPVIWGLNMSRERKIGVGVVFSIGLLYVPQSHR
jgi:hypothetical protein